MSRLSHLKAWFEGVEPGIGVLDWLELGSPGSWDLNRQWIAQGGDWLARFPVFPFVITGQSIDHKAYDHVNAYTGEMGSDGVVRSSAANLNASYVKLVQRPMPAESRTKLLALEAAEIRSIQSIPFALARGCSHSGDSQGIMRSIRNDGQAHSSLSAILDCLRVRNRRDYQRLRERFAALSREVAAAERVEERDLPGPYDHTRIKDPVSMVIFRVRDGSGHPVADFDLKLTAGPGGDPDRLPPGFLLDRQRNSRHPGILTFYFNTAKMLGSPPVEHDGRELRPALPACEGLGLRVVPYPLNGFVHYVPADLQVDMEHLRAFVRPYETVLVDIELRRVVHAGVYRLNRKASTVDFTDTPPGPPVAD